MKGQLQKPEEIDWSWLHNGGGITLLHAACHFRHIGVFEVAVARRPLLLRAQIGPAGSHQGETPLHFLVKGGQAAESAEEEEQAWGPQCHVPACFGFKGGCAEAVWGGFGPQEIMRVLELYLHGLSHQDCATVLGKVSTTKRETVFHHAVKPPAKPRVLQKLLQFGFDAGLDMRRILKQKNDQEPQKMRTCAWCLSFFAGGGCRGGKMCLQEETCTDLAEDAARKTKSKAAEDSEHHLRAAWGMIQGGSESNPTRNSGSKGQKRSRRPDDPRPRKEPTRLPSRS